MGVKRPFVRAEDGFETLLPPSPPPCGAPVVCVPARNEARRLPALIAALDAQRDLPQGRLRVVILLNNCVDASRAAVERAAAAAPRLDLRIEERRFPPPRAHAGSARRAAMEAGAGWLERIDAARGWLLTTDADAVPAPDWIARSRAALDAGADVAAAALNGDPVEEARFSPALRHAIVEAYTARMRAIALEDALDPTPGDPWPRHGDQSGGGLALRLAAYRAVGGCPAAPFREDLALVDSLRRLGGVVRRCPSIQVTVSARMRGRARGGMADTVRAWARRVAAGEALRVPDPAAQETHWRARAAIRRDAAAAAAALPPDLAARVVAAEVARRAPDPVDWPRLAPAPEALRTLERRLDDLTRARAAA